MVGLSFLAFKNGDPYKLVTPYDSDGNECGKPNQCGKGEADACADGAEMRDFTEYPLKHFTDITSKSDAIFNSICVKACPAGQTTPECMTNTELKECPL